MAYNWNVQERLECRDNLLNLSGILFRYTSSGLLTALCRNDSIFPNEYQAQTRQMRFVPHRHTTKTSAFLCDSAPLRLCGEIFLCFFLRWPLPPLNHPLYCSTQSQTVISRIIRDGRACTNSRIFTHCDRCYQLGI